MPQRLRTIALICGNPALAALLGGNIATERSLRVRHFESVIGLAFYARIATVDLLVADLDDGSFDSELLEGCDLPVGTPVIGLAHTVRPVSGVDEMIAKPMSPRYVRERVIARLAATPSPPPRPGRIPLPQNVVQLFPSS